MRPELNDWTEEEDAELRRLLKKRLSQKRAPGHDIKFVADMMAGELHEMRLESILESIEVKVHSGVERYGSVFVETEDRGRPSGISTCDAKYQAHVFGGHGYDGDVIVIIKTDRLRRIAERHIKIRGGEDSRGVRVFKETLLLTDKEINNFGVEI